VLAELLGGGRIVSIGGMGDGPPAFDYQESAARLRRMFNGDDADAQAVHAFLASMDVWEEFSQVQEKSNVRVSAGGFGPPGRGSSPCPEVVNTRR